MKAQSYILRYGSREEVERLAEQALQDAGLPAQPEAAALALRAAFAQSLLQGQLGFELSLRIIDRQLFIIGNSDALSFTI
jgi:hypothetical protein